MSDPVGTEEVSVFERKPAYSLGWRNPGAEGNKASVTVLGPRLPLACVTFGGLSVSSGSQIVFLIGD